jgi:NADH:ubiquinone reductase (H+-translocating)
MKTTILFIGGGYTTIWAYKQIVTPDIRKRIKAGQLELVVLCDRIHHYFHGFTGEVISGMLPATAICTPLQLLIPDATFIYGSATSVSPFLNTVKYLTQDGRKKEVHYDHLVIGCGTVDKDDSVAASVGVKKVDGLSNFLGQLKATLSACKAHTELKPTDEKEHIVLLGSGFTSVEMATNLSDYMQLNFGNIANVSIVNSGSGVLKEWQDAQPALVKYAEKIMKRKNIQVYRHSRVIERTKEGVYLSGGVFLKSRLVINAMGQQPQVLPGLKHLAMNPAGKIDTDAFLNAMGYDNIWCGGDIARIKKPFGNGDCPPNALWAIMQGSRIGRNIRRSLEGKRPLKFRFPGLGQAAAFGKGEGALELYGMAFKGWLAYIIRMGFFFYFFPAKMRLVSLYWQAIKEKRKEKTISHNDWKSGEEEDWISTQEKESLQVA